VPYKEPKAEKLFFSIGEVSEIFDINASTIRFWEKEFDTLNPQKNKKGKRFFTQEDINHIGLIYHLLKERGMTLKGAKMKIKENKEETEQTYEVVKKLQNIKKYLLEIKDMV
jgi:DNA-binding transcriptional MerR regulator